MDTIKEVKSDIIYIGDRIETLLRELDLIRDIDQLYISTPSKLYGTPGRITLNTYQYGEDPAPSLLGSSYLGMTQREVRASLRRILDILTAYKVGIVETASKIDKLNSSSLEVFKVLVKDEALISRGKVKEIRAALEISQKI